MPEVRSSNITNRHSIRKFSQEKVSEDDIEGILRAGILAPSSKNRQPWSFKIITGGLKETMVASMRGEIENKIQQKTDSRVDVEDYLSALKTMGAMEQAPIVILVCYEDRHRYPGVSTVPWESEMTDRELVDTLSIGAAMENMALEATERGLGSLWIGDFLYAYDSMIESTGIDGKVVSAMAIGHAAENRHTSVRQDDVIEFL